MNVKGEITVAKVIQKIVSIELSTPVSCKVDVKYDQDIDFYKCDMLYRIPKYDVDISVHIDSNGYNWTFSLDKNNNTVHNVYKDILSYLNTAGEDKCGLIPIDFSPVVNIKNLKHNVTNSTISNINNLYNFRKLS